MKSIISQALRVHGRREWPGSTPWPASHKHRRTATPDAPAHDKQRRVTPPRQRGITGHVRITLRRVTSARAHLLGAWNNREFPMRIRFRAVTALVQIATAVALAAS